MSPILEPHYAFTQKYEGIARRLITPIRISEPFDPDHPPPTPKFIEAKALWDTGATNSVITGKTAQALGLTPVGRARVRHGGGEGDFNTHLVNIVLPNKVGISGVLVSECPDTEFDAIIGMDIISRGDMSISNHNGKTWFTFRFPSVGSHDFVQDGNQGAPRRAIAHVGRNEPCPCGKRDGTGKPIKFKKCHGKG